MENRYKTQAYKDAKVYVALLRCDLFQIAHATSDPDTKQRIEELLDNMSEPKIIRRFEGRIQAIEEKPK